VTGQPGPAGADRHRSAVDGHASHHRSGLPVLRRFPLCRHAIAITPADWYHSLPQPQRPSPYYRRVGFRIAHFEACLAFTHVMACLLTRSYDTSYTKGFRRFVTSTPALAATGWSDRCRVGLSPIEKPRLFTAHYNIQARAGGSRDAIAELAQFVVLRGGILSSSLPSVP
jgi:hypothetical protein